MRVRTSNTTEEHKSKYTASSNKLQKTNSKDAKNATTAHPTDPTKLGETQKPLNVNKNQVKLIRTGRQSQWREKNWTWGTETIPDKLKPENLNKKTPKLKLCQTRQQAVRFGENTGE